MIHRILILFFTLLATNSAVAEISTINCPTAPPYVRRLELHERWRIDAEDPDSPLLGCFGPSQVVWHEGFVYLLDQQLCHILVYTDDGIFQGTIMREGEGPGEVRNPGAMLLCSNGSLAVQHGYPTKLEFIDHAGTPQGRWQLQANAWANRIQETSLGWFAIYTESKQSDEPNVFTSVFHVALHDSNGLRTEEYYREQQQVQHQQSGRTEEVDEYIPWYTAVAVGMGQVVIAPSRDQYRLEWRGLSGEVSRIVTREIKAHRRSTAELDELKYSSYSIMNGDLRFKDRKLCAYDPMISAIDPLPDGRLRVRTSFFEKDLPQGMVCRYELHGPDGQLLEQVEIYDPSNDYDVDYDTIVLLGDDRAMVLRNLRPAARAAIGGRLHPKLIEKLPPPPDSRDDIAYTPIMCDLVPRHPADREPAGQGLR